MWTDRMFAVIVVWVMPTMALVVVPFSGTFPRIERPAASLLAGFRWAFELVPEVPKIRPRMTVTRTARMMIRSVEAQSSRSQKCRNDKHRRHDK